MIDKENIEQGNVNKQNWLKKLLGLNPTYGLHKISLGKFKWGKTINNENNDKNGNIEQKSQKN